MILPGSLAYNKSYIKSFLDAKGTFSTHWVDTDTQIFTAADCTDPVRMYAYPSSDVATAYFYGLVNIDFSMKGGMGAVINLDCNWSAAGAITWKS